MSTSKKVTATKSRPRRTRAPRTEAATATTAVIESLVPALVARTPSGDTLTCAVLRTSEGPPLVLAPGDRVLVFGGVVLGRIEAFDPNAGDDVKLTAKKSLTVKVGESALELTAQGKITVRGVDVVSSAKRKNRIKGGSVEIN